ncbi:hypothetical protein M514_22484 [Trichuris suis]|uniref:Uncharacterized protein n=1 Tax=Trichuris suis TaxID=68888 RepID=A0A085N778_9BILA|nr:hypothetical protein M514_22484 [Trichuris suis]
MILSSFQVTFSYCTTRQVYCRNVTSHSSNAPPVVGSSLLSRGKNSSKNACCLFSDGTVVSAIGGSPYRGNNRSGRISATYPVDRVSSSLADSPSPIEGDNSRCENNEAADRSDLLYASLFQGLRTCAPRDDPVPSSVVC